MHIPLPKSIADKFCVLNRFLWIVTLLLFSAGANLSAKTFNKEFFQKNFNKYQLQLTTDEKSKIITMPKLGKKESTKINRTIKEYRNNSQYRLLVVGAGWERSYLKSYEMDSPKKVKYLKSYRYTVDIDPKMAPDLVGDIRSKKAMSSLPDNFFDSVIFEFIYCDVYLDTDTYDIIYRVLKPGGTFYGGVASSCARLAPFVIENTPFQGQQNYDILKFPKGQLVFTRGFMFNIDALPQPYELTRFSSFVFIKATGRATTP